MSIALFSTTQKIEHGKDMEPVCHIFRSKLRVEEAHQMPGDELWSYFARELIQVDTASKDYCKWFCFMSFTRYTLPENMEAPRSHGDVLSHTKGHATLGNFYLLRTWMYEKFSL